MLFGGTSHLFPSTFSRFYMSESQPPPRSHSCILLSKHPLHSALLISPQPCPTKQSATRSLKCPMAALLFMLHCNMVLQALLPAYGLVPAQAICFQFCLPCVLQGSGEMGAASAVPAWLSPSWCCSMKHLCALKSLAGRSYYSPCAGGSPSIAHLSHSGADRDLCSQML